MILSVTGVTFVTSAARLQQSAIDLHTYSQFDRKYWYPAKLRCSFLPLGIDQMVARLDAPQPVYIFPPIETIPDDVEDQPASGLSIVTL